MKRLCKFCLQPLAPNKRSHALFCSIPCKKSSEHKRRMLDPEKRERSRLRSKSWREDNPDKAKKNVSEWQKLNKAKCSAIGRRYSLRKLKAMPPWLSEDHQTQITAFYEARDSETARTGILYEVDHIVPLQGKTVCGLHVPWNLQVITKEENVAKKNFYWPDMWTNEETTLLEEVEA